MAKLTTEQPDDDLQLLGSPFPGENTVPVVHLLPHEADPMTLHGKQPTELDSSLLEAESGVPGSNIDVRHLARKKKKHKPYPTVEVEMEVVEPGSATTDIVPTRMHEQQRAALELLLRDKKDIIEGDIGATTRYKESVRYDHDARIKQMNIEYLILIPEEVVQEGLLDADVVGAPVHQDYQTERDFNSTDLKARMAKALERQKAWLESSTRQENNGLSDQEKVAAKVLERQQAWLRSITQRTD